MDVVKEWHSRDYYLIYYMGALYCITHNKVSFA